MALVVKLVELNSFKVVSYLSYLSFSIKILNISNRHDIFVHNANIPKTHDLYNL